MNDDVRSRDGGAEHRLVAQIADRYVDRARPQLLSDARLTNEGADRMPLSEEILDHVTPDEPGRAGYEESHSGIPRGGL